MFAIPIDELTHFYVSPPIGQKNLTDDGWEKGSEDLIALRSNNSGAESNRGERVEVGWIKSNWVLLTKYFQLDRKKMFANWSLSDCEAASAVDVDSFHFIFFIFCWLAQWSVFSSSVHRKKRLGRWMGKLKDWIYGLLNLSRVHREPWAEK